ncbi:MAG TPA: FAD-dependent oxidoreductase, partial [Pirellulaceae bacterium]
MRKSYDVIVLGLGGVGSAAAWQLSRRGLRTLGLERFSPGHAEGSSHGSTRAIRMAYFEHPDYVPLLRRAYTLWDELEAVTRQRLFFRVGLLEVGPGDGTLVPGALRAAAEHDLSVERLTALDCAQRFPQFRPPPDSHAVWEPNAGYLLVEACVLAQVMAARAQGAELLFDTLITGWGHDG